MLTRLITAAVMILFFFITVFGLPTIVTAVLVALMTAIAAYELLHRTGLVNKKAMVAGSMTAAALVPLWCYFGAPYVWGALGVLLFTAFLFSQMMLDMHSATLDKTAYCLMAGLLLPWLLSSLVRLQSATAAYCGIMIPVVLACVSDGGAYFAGRFFGKHRLAPVISPKKTVEGAVGGVLLTVVGMLIYAAVVDKSLGYTVNYFYAAVYGVVGAVCAIFGDLCFSVIKRQVGIKDYGNLFPGHGGILDRFDSMMIVGPVTETLLLLLPLVV